MTRPPKSLVIFGVIVALVATVGTGGVSSFAAERDVQVTVAADQDAFLGFEQQPTATANGTTDLIVTVTNQYDVGTTLQTVVLTSNQTTVEMTRNRSLASGTSHTETLEDVPCDGMITIEARGAGVYTTFERPVSCL